MLGDIRNSVSYRFNYSNLRRYIMKTYVIRRHNLLTNEIMWYKVWKHWVELEADAHQFSSFDAASIVADSLHIINKGDRFLVIRTS